MPVVERRGAVNQRRLFIRSPLSAVGDRTTDGSRLLGPVLSSETGPAHQGEKDNGPVRVGSQPSRLWGCS